MVVYRPVTASEFWPVRVLEHADGSATAVYANGGERRFESLTRLCFVHGLRLQALVPVSVH